MKGRPIIMGKTGFDKATGGDGVADVIDDTQGGSPIPRAVFTRENVIDTKNMQVSQLRVAQSQSQEVKDKKAAEGQLVLANFVAMDEVLLIPLMATPIRVYKTDARKPPVCHSPTGNFGFGDPGGVCVDDEGNPVCPFAKWGEPKPGSKTNTPPACKDGMMLRCYSVTHRSVVDMQFLAGDKGKGSFVQQQAMSYGWAKFVIRVSTSEKKNDRGSWAVPDIEMLGDMPVKKDGVTPMISQEQWDNAEKWFAMFQADQINSREDAIIQLRAIN